MSKPITWRNVGTEVQAPRLDVVSNILGQAQQGLDKAFTGAGNLINDFQGIQEANQKNQVNLNTEQFLNTLNARFRDPNALAQAQQSGELDALRQQFGQYGLDTTKTNAAAIDTLVGEQRTRAQADQEYADFQTRLGNRAVRDAHDVAIAEGRFEDAARIRAENEFLNEGAMAQAQTSAENAQVDRNWTLEQRNNTRQDRAEVQQQKALRKQGQAMAAEAFLRMAEPGANATQIRNSLVSDLMSIPGMTMDMVTEMATNADNADYLTSQLSRRDQAALDKELATLDTALAKNEFYQWEKSDESPAKAANRVVQNAQAKIDDGWNKEEIHDFALVAMTDGFDLGTGVKMPLPPEAVEFVINHPDVGALWNGDPDDHVKRLILDNEYWKEKLLENTQGKIDRKTKQTEYLKNTLSNAEQEQALADRRGDGDTVGYFLQQILNRKQ